MTFLKPIIAAMLLSCLACGGGYTVVEPGPHPAPAYAYRHRHPHDRVMLVYDPAIRVYAVTGYPHYYYSGGRYYRVKGTTWYRTSRLDGPWRVVSYKYVPSGLHVKYKQTAVKEKKNKNKSHKKSNQGYGAK